MLQKIWEKLLGLTRTEEYCLSGSVITPLVKRKEILDSYYKAMFVRHPFERLASAYRDKKKKKWFQRLIYPENEELREKIKFSAFISVSF